MEWFNYRLAYSLSSDKLTDFLELDYQVTLQSIGYNKGIFSNVLTSKIVEFKFFKADKND